MLKIFATVIAVNLATTLLHWSEGWCWSIFFICLIIDVAIAPRRDNG